MRMDPSVIVAVYLPDTVNMYVDENVPSNRLRAIFKLDGVFI